MRPNRPDVLGSGAWTRVDTGLAIAVTLFAGGIRGFHAGRPGGMVWDEFYALDGCLYVTPSPQCHITAELTPGQPPLGKWLIGWGIDLVGFGTRGWRVAPVLFGTLTVLVLYILARRLGVSRLGATLAAGLLSLDFLHVVLSRTAMLDVFVTFFSVLAFLWFAFDRTTGDRLPDALPRPRRRWIPPRPWLLLSGIAGGAAVACKWSGLPMLVAILALTVALDATRRRRSAARAVRAGLGDSATVAAYLVLVPALVYAASYAGRVDGSLIALPWSDGAWVRALLARQQQMWQFHVGLHGDNPYASPPWSWLLLKRPVAMYFGEDSTGRYVEVLALGSPLVWGAALVALVHQVLRLVRRRTRALAPTVAVVGFLAGYAPWFVVAGSRQQMFLYYLLPAVPFMCLALGLSIDGVAERLWGKAVTAALVAVCVGSFVFYYPLLVARPITPDSWRHRILLQDCQQSQQDHTRSELRPRTSAGPPPPGWCWA